MKCQNYFLEKRIGTYFQISSAEFLPRVKDGDEMQGWNDITRKEKDYNKVNNLRHQYGGEHVAPTV